MVLPSIGTKRAKNENSQSCFCFGSFRNCSTNEYYNRSFKNEKNENGYQITLILYHKRLLLSRKVCYNVTVTELFI